MPIYNRKLRHCEGVRGPPSHRSWLRTHVCRLCQLSSNTPIIRRPWPFWARKVGFLVASIAEVESVHLSLLIKGERPTAFFLVSNKTNDVGVAKDAVELLLDGEHRSCLGGEVTSLAWRFGDDCFLTYSLVVTSCLIVWAHAKHDR